MVANQNLSDSNSSSEPIAATATQENSNSAAAASSQIRALPGKAKTEEQAIVPPYLEQTNANMQISQRLAALSLNKEEEAHAKADLLQKGNSTGTKTLGVGDIDTVAQKVSGRESFVENPQQNVNSLPPELLAMVRNEGNIARDNGISATSSDASAFNHTPASQQQGGGVEL